MLKLFVAALFLSLTLSEALGTDLNTYSIEPELLELLENDEPANIIISLSQGTDAVLEAIKRRSWAGRTEKIEALAKALEEQAKETHGPALRILAQYPDLEVRSLWISNEILVRGINRKVLNVLVQTLKADIGKISKEKVIPLIPVIREPERRASTRATYQWGVQRIEAPTAWTLTGATNGRDVIVATIDTGVRASHEALRSSYISGFGWHDAANGLPTPYDNVGHGTHTMGTILGSVNGIGVAPGARWITCKGCDTESCLGGDLIACGQWVLCPQAANGTKDCSKAPQLVSNSWGGGQGDFWYQNVVNGWLAVEIVPIFAIGNSESDPPTCYTANSPGDYANVIGVGAMAFDTTLAFFSSRGPVSYPTPQPGNLIKPDLSAPGVNVYSSVNTSDTAYEFYSGTSMAAPHVAGTVALMISVQRRLSYLKIRSCLLKATVHSGVWLTQPELSCPFHNHTSPYTYPNNDFGQGLVNAKGAVQRALTLNC